jgi:hypothetical protein
MKVIIKIYVTMPQSLSTTVMIWMVNHLLISRYGLTEACYGY